MASGASDGELKVYLIIDGVPVVTLQSAYERVYDLKTRVRFLEEKNARLEDLAFNYHEKWANLKTKDDADFEAIMNLLKGTENG